MILSDFIGIDHMYIYIYIYIYIYTYMFQLNLVSSSCYSENKQKNLSNNFLQGTTK